MVAFIDGQHVVGIASSPAQVQGLNIILLASLSEGMIVAEEKRLFRLVVRIDQVEHKGERYELKSVDLVILAVLDDILEEVLLIGELMVVLEMVE